MLHLNEELLDDISFQAQDVWSLGCLLVWLVTGELPFLCFLEELEICKISQLECMCLKHAAWVSSPIGSSPFSCHAAQELQLLLAIMPTSL